MAQGAILLHREIRDHWLWKKKPYSPGQAWVDMLLLANHAGKRVPFRDEITEILRGEFIRSERDLARDWGWARSKIHRFLILLKNDSMIDIKSDQKANHISICNYNKWQKFRTNNEPIVNQEWTKSEPVVDLNNECITNDNHVNQLLSPPEPPKGEPNNGPISKPKRRKTEKPIEYAEDFLTFWKAYPRKDGKAGAFEQWRKSNGGRPPLDKIIARLEIHKKSSEWAEESGKFIPWGERYIKKRRWEDETDGGQDDAFSRLREKYKDVK